jgi:TRAP-type mannitol/chloroaromatic compound transport system permease large subunit
LFLIAMELGLLTPPFGLLLFVMKGVAPKEIAIQAVYRAAIPFIGLELAVLAILIAFPGLALFLPKLIN